MYDSNEVSRYSSPENNTANMWALALHLSLFAGVLVPFAGFIAPIVIWQVYKDDYPIIDQHGQIVANWIINALVYSVVCFILTFVVIGILLFAILGVCAIAFPIIGGVKASKGEVWDYPLNFIRVF